MNAYDQAYGKYGDVFGSTPDLLLQRFRPQLDIRLPVLDVGAGQGRHSLFLARAGFRVVALETSSVAVRTLEKLARKEHLNIRVINQDFELHTVTDGFYGTVMLFGLVQILSPDQLHRLKLLVKKWLAPGGFLLCTAFGINDAGMHRLRSVWQEIEPGLFWDGKGNFRRYLKTGGLLSMFPEFICCHNWNGSGPWHHHGDGKMERHDLQEVVLQKSVFDT